MHLRDCVTLKKQRVDSAELVDVEWASDVQGEFDAGVRVLVSDRRGLLADLATAISDSQANIDAISMEKPDGARRDRDVLRRAGARPQAPRAVMRNLRHIPDVRRVQRART